jgi:MFS transporter, NNP family, nitrate/nitrite transporter
MIAPMAPTFQALLRLTDQQAWMMIATPVLLGSIIRLPMGMLADRHGGRKVFGILLLFIALPAFMLSRAATYGEFMFWALLLGMAGTSFSVGVAFTSKWFPPQKQGFALGIYGAGNIGQSLALFGIPYLSGVLGGWQVAYQVFAVVALVYAVIFLALAKDAPVPVVPKSFAAMLSVIRTQPLTWLLSLFYFVTFGGFVALSIGLPKVLHDVFGLTKTDAGLRIAVLVLVATTLRPVGGWLSDRIGGARVLAVVFAAAAVLALGMTFEQIAPFTIGALGVAAFIGLGNGAVFKLVPQYFPNDTGTVTGLVGAIGGLGGFFPPLVLGFIKAGTGSYALGFIFLSVFCVGCAAMNYLVFFRSPRASAATT